MDNDTLPQYIQIALSIARRIAGGDVPGSEDFRAIQAVL